MSKLEPKNPYPYQLEAPIEERDMGTKANGSRLFYRAMYLSEDLERSLSFGPGSKLRVEGLFERIPVELAFVPGGSQGGHYIMLSKSLLKQAGKRVGDRATFLFRPVEDRPPDLPFELEDALEEQGARPKWDALTPGRQRTWTSYVDRAKRPQTRHQKAAEVAARVLIGKTNPRDEW